LSAHSLSYLFPQPSALICHSPVPVAFVPVAFKTYRLEQVAKEYYIIKPLLRDDRKFGPFINALDSAILSSGVDDVCEEIYGRPEKK